MKLKKKSGLIGLISVLAGVSVVSVGFAAWVVSAGDTGSVSGEIKVETMQDERHTIKDIASLNAVKYGAPANPAAKKGVVLSYNETGAQKENLNITFSFKVRKLTTATLKIKLESTGSVWYKPATQNTKAAFATSDPDDSDFNEVNGYDTALSLGLVGALPSYEYNGQTATGSGTNVTGFAVTAPTQQGDEFYTVTGTLEFKWGSHFANSWADQDETGDPVNPFVFYNTLANDEDSDEINAAAADAVESLGALQACLNSVGYTMTISTAHVDIA